MLQRRQKRLLKVIWLVTFLSIGIAAMLYTLRSNISVYATPSEFIGLVDKSALIDLGGMVAKGSFKRLGGVNISFVITDFKKSITVKYAGVLPTLFREGQGVIVSGRMQADGLFKASRVLAKHDENYRPPHLPKDQGQPSPLDLSKGAE